MHQHDHGSHSHEIGRDQAGSRAFRIGIALNLAYVLVEAGVGLHTGSLSLLTDAGHNLSDVASLLLSLFAFFLARRRPTAAFTYGYRKSTVLAALVNAVILLVAIGVIAYEAILRFGNPHPLPGGLIAWVAGLGILVNVGSALLFRREAELNARSAYLHLMADALVSAGVVVAGIIIHFTKWYLLDTIVSLAVCVVILISTWSLLRDSLRLSLDAVPRDIDLDAIRQRIEALPSVLSFSHIHVWAISTTENALTGHLRVHPEHDPHRVVDAVKHELRQMNIHHPTIELDSAPPAESCDLDSPVEPHAH